MARADEVGGRICVVVERRLAGDRRIEMSLDDLTGRMLRLAFTDVATGRRVFYDYSEFRRVGSLRLPHRRVLRLGDEFGPAYADVRITGYAVESGPADGD